MIRSPYLLFLGAAPTRLDVKTATGVLHWRPEDCVGQWRTGAEAVDLGLPDLDPQGAHARGAHSLLLGAANEGGFLDPAWLPHLEQALEDGLDLVSGMHEPLTDHPGLVQRAQAHGRSLIDVRRPKLPLPIATGEPRTGRRLLTVGSDCVVGKMFTVLALERAMRARGWKADFRATGQTGILIAGSGIPLDAVPADFIAGAVEALTPPAEPDHWDLIEGQGALEHPLYGGVTLGLVHGAQAEALVLCHDARRTHLDGLPRYPIAPFEELIERYEQAARLTEPRARVVGLSVNTSSMEDDEALALLASLSERLGRPAVDAVRTGVDPLLDVLEAAS